MTYMAQLPSQGHRTWTCGCGRLGLALAVDACPACGQPRPDGTAGEPAAAVPAAVAAAVPAQVPPAPRRRARARAPRGHVP